MSLALYLDLVLYIALYVALVSSLSISIALALDDLDLTLCYNQIVHMARSNTLNKI